MFKKTARQLIVFLFLILIFFWFPRSILPSQMNEPIQDSFETYYKLNESEHRLSAYKDSDEVLKLKLNQVDIINNSRKKHKATPVKLDILASRVANKMCREAAENNYVGHWNMAGEKPYHRYAFAGGYDHVSENAYGEWSSANYNQSSSTISTMMKSGHASFMAERSPNNGHKMNIIDKSHNFAGIGFYLIGNQFRYYEEFIDRYFEFENIPENVKVGEPCSITVKTNGDKFIYFLIIYREKFPLSLTLNEINRKGSYNDYTNETFLTKGAWDIKTYKSGSSYKIPLIFSKEGLYYIHLYYDEKEITKPTSLNTKGKTPVSGIVIKVNR